jgi:hypothetical protein
VKSQVRVASKTTRPQTTDNRQPANKLVSSAVLMTCGRQLLKTPQGRSIVVSVRHDDTVRDVKLQVAQSEAVDPSRVRLVFAGVPMGNDSLWRDCGVDDESVVHVLISP